MGVPSVVTRMSKLARKLDRKLSACQTKVLQAVESLPDCKKLDVYQNLSDQYTKHLTNALLIRTRLKEVK